MSLINVADLDNSDCASDLEIVPTIFDRFDNQDQEFTSTVDAGDILEKLFSNGFKDYPEEMVQPENETISLSEEGEMEEDEQEEVTIDREPIDFIGKVINDYKIRHGSLDRFFGNLEVETKENCQEMEEPEKLISLTDEEGTDEDGEDSLEIEQIKIDHDKACFRALVVILGLLAYILLFSIYQAHMEGLDDKMQRYRITNEETQLFLLYKFCLTEELCHEASILAPGEIKIIEIEKTFVLPQTNHMAFIDSFYVESPTDVPASIWITLSTYRDNEKIREFLG